MGRVDWGYCVRLRDGYPPGLSKLGSGWLHGDRVVGVLPTNEWVVCGHDVKHMRQRQRNPAVTLRMSAMIRFASLGAIVSAPSPSSALYA